MAFNPDIHDRAYQFFIEEVPELLQAIEDGILTLRQDRSANVVHEVMRSAHSIKGGAASVELEAIKEISHRLETAFRALYDESVDIDVELETLLLQGYDCLQQPLNEQMETGSHDPEQALAKAMPVLEAIENKLGAEALSQADSFIPSSSDLGVDMVTSIFEIDVEQGIARLEEVAANPSAFPVAGELQTQAEVFTGFGELLELPGFGAIAQAITDAVTQAPDRANEILTVALADLKAARDVVMAGDRDQGGTPSEALLALASGGGATGAAAPNAVGTADVADALPATQELSLTDAGWGDDDAFPLDVDAAALQELLGGAAIAEPTSDQAPESIGEATSAQPANGAAAADFLLDDIAFPEEPLFPADALDAAEPSVANVAPADTSAVDFGAVDIGDAEVKAVDDAVSPLTPVETSDESTATAPAVNAVSQSVEDPWVLPTEEIPIEEVLASVKANALEDEGAMASESTAMDAVAATDVSPESMGGQPFKAPEPKAPEPNASLDVKLDANLDVTPESGGVQPQDDNSASPDATAAPSPLDAAADNLADLFGLDDSLASAPSLQDEQSQGGLSQSDLTPEKGEAAGSESTDAVSALFGLEADNDMSPEEDIFSQVDWQADDSLQQAPETEQPVAEPSISAIADMASETPNASEDAPADFNLGEAPVVGIAQSGEQGNEQGSEPAYSSTDASQDLSNLLGAFDLDGDATEPSIPASQTVVPEGTVVQLDDPLESAGVQPMSAEQPAPAAASASVVPEASAPAAAPATETAPAVEPVSEPTVEPAAEPVASGGAQSEPSLTAGIDELFDEGTFIQSEMPAEVMPSPAVDMTNAAVEVAIAELQSIQPETPSPDVVSAPGSENVAAAAPTNVPSPQPMADSPVDASASVSVPPQPAATPSLDAAVQAVEQLFDQLPANAPGAVPDAVPGAALSAAAPAAGSAAGSALAPKAAAAQNAAAEPKKKAEKKRKAAPLSGISVRVDLSVLERMNNLVGELVLNRNSLSLQNEQLQTVVGQLAKRFKNFEGLLTSLREVSDQMLVKPNQPPMASGNALPTGNILQAGQDNLTAGFDSLEMDRYSGLHTQLQDIFEELMQLEEGVDDIDVLLEQSTQSIGQQRQGLSRLQNELMWARMLPLDNILSRFPRVLRDLAAKHGKSVDLKLDGTSVLVDKGILEKLHDPMLHLLRNAFDHGIEAPDARKQQGKDERGTIAIRAFYQGNQTVIEIKDDGRGLSLEKIARRAVDLGWMTREELKTIPQQVIADLIFEPGFSTAAEVSELSGRGVGLDVVREQLKSLKGSVSVSSAPGEGTKFSLKLPLTLSVAKLMVCQVGPLAIALPSDAIEDLLVPEPKRIKTVAKQRFLHWHDDLIPIHPMSELLDYSCPLPDATSLKNLTDATIPVPQEWAMPILIFKQGEQFFALEVNRLLMEQELVIKPFGNAAQAPEYAYGCTILGDGQMIPVFDASALLGSLTEETSGFSGTGINLGDDAGAPAAPAAPSMSSVGSTRMSKTILVVDDSTAMRRTLALSLEKAGYRILQAGDGQEALEQLRQSSTIQLVICDVEMPTMNGFEFLSQRRREPELLKIPVVMLTSRSSDKHRRLALQLNANGYFSKPYVEQEFLKAIRGMLDESPAAATV